MALFTCCLLFLVVFCDSESSACNTTIEQTVETNTTETKQTTRTYTPECNKFVRFFAGVFSSFLNVENRCAERTETVSRTVVITQQVIETTVVCCPGYRENDTGHCVADCYPGLYGINCTQNCTCPGNAFETCEQVTGNCTCKPGWFGKNCTEECEDGFYGYDCQQKCICENNGTCNKTNGECFCGDPGWTGDRCELRCNGTYGHGCNTTCDCKVNETCDAVTGACSCKPGYRDVQCTQECEAWSFGNNCTDNCTCNRHNTEQCDVTSGSCDCRPGYTGVDCSYECTMQTFGKHCEENCACLQYPNQYCDHVNGTCLCLPGKTGHNCTQDCPDGFYGQDCNNSCTCSNNTINGNTCDPVDGSCNCARGWTGSSCDEGCAYWFYGFNCSEECACDRNLTVSCNVTSGTCNCREGYKGNNCNTSLTNIAAVVQNPESSNVEIAILAAIITGCILFCIFIAIAAIVTRTIRKRQHRDAIVENHLYESSGVLLSKDSEHGEVFIQLNSATSHDPANDYTEGNTLHKSQDEQKPSSAANKRPSRQVSLSDDLDDEELYTEVDDPEDKPAKDGDDVYDRTSTVKKLNDSSVRVKHEENTYHKLGDFKHERSESRNQRGSSGDTEELYETVEDEEEYNSLGSVTTTKITDVESKNEYNTFKQVQEMSAEADPTAKATDAPPTIKLRPKAEREEDGEYNRLNYSENAKLADEENISSNVYNRLSGSEDYGSSAAGQSHLGGQNYGQLHNNIHGSVVTALPVDGSDEEDYAFCEIEDDKPIQEQEYDECDITVEDEETDDSKSSVRRLVPFMDKSDSTVKDVKNEGQSDEEEDPYEEFEIESQPKSPKKRPTRKSIYEPYELPSALASANKTGEAGVESAQDSDLINANAEQEETADPLANKAISEEISSGALIGSDSDPKDTLPKENATIEENPEENYDAPDRDG